MTYNISDRGVSYVRDRIQQLMTSSVSIYSHAEPVLNESTGLLESPLGAAKYTGKARIWESNTGETILMGEAAVTMSRTSISIPFDTTYIPVKDDIVKVLTCFQDKSLVGKYYRVVSIDGNGQIGAVRRMGVVSYSPSSVWEPS